MLISNIKKKNMKKLMFEIVMQNVFQNSFLLENVLK